MKPESSLGEVLDFAGLWVCFLFLVAAMAVTL